MGTVKAYKPKDKNVRLLQAYLKTNNKNKKKVLY